jgi:hypothetical protein
MDPATLNVERCVAQRVLHEEGEEAAVGVRAAAYFTPWRELGRIIL